MNNSEKELEIQFLKIAFQQNEIKAWQEVIQEVESPMPKQLIGAAVDYMTSAVSGFTKASKELEGVPEEDILLALEAGSKIPGAFGKDAQINIEAIEKFASDFDSMNKTAQLKWLSTLGKGFLRVVPIIGPVFSLLFAFKNFVYSIIEGYRLLSVSSEVGMNWYEPLYPSRVKEKIIELKESAEDLKTMSDVCKRAKMFVDEVISLIANSIDFIKDVIFLAVEIIMGAISAAASAGTIVLPPVVAGALSGWTATLGLGALDASISIIIMIIEYFAEEAAKAEYNVALEDIVTIAKENIRKLRFSDISDEDFFRTLSEKEESQISPAQKRNFDEISDEDFFRSHQSS